MKLFSPPFRFMRANAGWFTLIFLFLLSGIIGHDPWWRKGETYSFGIVYHFLKTSTWLVPVNAEIPFMEKPPLYYWSAVLLCKVLGGIMALPDAARMTSFFYMIVTLIFMWKLSQRLFCEKPDKETLGWISIVLLIGSYGAAFDIHDSVTDIALLMGTVIALYGIASLITSPDGWMKAAVWTGIGVGVAFLSKGLLIPAVLFLSGIAFLAVFHSLHTSITSRFVCMALAVASPLLFIWPTMLYLHSHALFNEWFWENNIGRFVGFSVEKYQARNMPFYFLYMAPQYAFPSFWLACAETITGWRLNRKKPCYLFPLIVSVVGMFVLLVSASGRAIYLLPFVPVFALLGAQALMRVPAGFLSIWNKLAAVVFIGGAIIFWEVWIDLHYQMHWFPKLVKKWLPIDYIPAGGQLGMTAFACIVTLAGIASLRWRTCTATSTARNWLAGVLLLYGLCHTLLLPWLNEKRSHGPVMMRLIDFIEHSSYANECIGTYQLDEDSGPMVRYFSGRSMPLQSYNSVTCPLILSQAPVNSPLDVNAGWHLIWQDRLIYKPDEEFRLYELQKKK